MWNGVFTFLHIDTCYIQGNSLKVKAVTGTWWEVGSAAFFWGHLHRREVTKTPKTTLQKLQHLTWKNKVLWLEPLGHQCRRHVLWTPNIVCVLKKKKKQAQTAGLKVSRWDLMTPRVVVVVVLVGGWQFVRRCLQARQLWTPWDSLDESILHLYSQEKGEDNCSVLMAASNCSERWRIVMKPRVNNHLGGDKSPDKPHTLLSSVFIFK